jgi:hypothetical protein
MNLDFEEVFVNSGVEDIEIGIWGDDAFLKCYDRLYNTCNPTCSFEMANIRLDCSSKLSYLARDAISVGQGGLTRRAGCPAYALLERQHQ